LLGGNATQVTQKSTQFSWQRGREPTHGAIDVFRQRPKSAVIGRIKERIDADLLSPL